MSEIIKLDEYLSRNKHSMVNAAADALDIDPQEVMMLWKKREEEVRFSAEEAGQNPDTASFELEKQLMQALDVDTSNDEAAEAAVEAIRNILAPREVDMWENAFDGVDKEGGYHLRFHVESEKVRNQFMDWLEEGGDEYLINRDGHFAIKCEDRNRKYGITRALEKMKNRWDRPTDGSAVDPDSHEKRLSVKYPTKNNKTIVRDNVKMEGEIVPFPKPDDSEPEVQDQLPTRASRANKMGDEALFDYAYNIMFGMAVNGEGGGNMDDMLDQIEQEIGRDLSPYRRANLKAKLEDELGQDQIERNAWKHGTMKPRVIQGGAMEELSGDLEEGKIKNKKKQPPKPRDPNWRDALAMRQSGAAGAHSPSKYSKGDRKANKVDKRNIGEAMEELIKNFVAEVAEKFDNDHRQMLPYMIGFLRDSVEMSDITAATVVTESIKKNAPLNERFGGVMGTGVTGLQNLGRIRQLAGIQMDTDDCGEETEHGDTTVTVEPTTEPVAIPVPANTDQPSQVQTSETHDLATAIDTLKCALEVYKNLDNPSRKAFKAYVTDSLMGDCGQYSVQDGGMLAQALGLEQ